MKNLFKLSAMAAVFVASTTCAFATPFTMTSPTGGLLPAGVSAVGGIVVDLTGSNGNRVVSQVAAGTEYIGFPDASENPLLFGTQFGFDAGIVSQLGGGITSASFRVSLYDGDSQSGNFDFNDNNLLVNGIDFGNFSSVATQETDGLGTTVFSSGFGFGDDILGTGFFSSTNGAALASLFASLSSGKIEFRLNDVDPGDQYFDFTQGIDSSLINVGSGPVVTPPTNTPVPEPSTILMLGTGLLGAASQARRRFMKK